jgi:hypothetical protein
MLSLHLLLGFPSGSFPRDYPPKFCMYSFSLSSQPHAKLIVLRNLTITITRIYSLAPVKVNTANEKEVYVLFFLFCNSSSALLCDLFLDSTGCKVE